MQVDGVLDRKGLAALLARKPKARTTPAALKSLKEHLPLLEQLQSLVELLRQQRLAVVASNWIRRCRPRAPGELAPGLPDHAGRDGCRPGRWINLCIGLGTAAPG